MPRPGIIRPLPIRCLTPGTPFRCPPGGVTEGGIFLELVGGDAKVLPTGATATTYWSGEAPVFRAGTPVPIPRSVPSGPSRAERKEVKAKIERIMHQSIAPLAPPSMFFGDEG